ncbi:MAG: hypothetical protein ACREB9_03500 [Thermoplasmata archaeon]
MKPLSPRALSPDRREHVRLRARLAVAAVILEASAMRGLSLQALSLKVGRSPGWAWHLASGDRGASVESLALIEAALGLPVVEAVGRFAPGLALSESESRPLEVFELAKGAAGRLLDAREVDFADLAGLAAPATEGCG